MMGSIGELPAEATIILSADGLPNQHTATQSPPAAVFYPIYTSHLGLGRIVELQWNGEQPSLEGLTAHQFYLRCIQWLADGRAAADAHK